MLLVLTGCSLFNKKDVKNDQLEAYYGYYEEILNCDILSSNSDDFDFEFVVNKVDEKQYRFDLIIDEPKVAMYEIKVLAIVDNIDEGINREEMMPSIGIIDGTSYNMIPHQVDKEQNYVEGLILSFISESEELRADFVIDYKNSSKEEVKEFYTVHNVYKEPEQ